MFGPHVKLFAPSAGERWLYVAVHVATWLGIAVLWWLLAGVACSAGRGSPFTVENAHRLTVAGSWQTPTAFLPLSGRRRR